MTSIWEEIKRKSQIYKKNERQTQSTVQGERHGGPKQNYGSDSDQGESIFAIPISRQPSKTKPETVDDDYQMFAELAEGSIERKPKDVQIASKQIHQSIQPMQKQLSYAQMKRLYSEKIENQSRLNQRITQLEQQCLALKAAAIKEQVRLGEENLALKKRLQLALQGLKEQ